MSVPGMAISVRARGKVVRSKWCQAIDGLPAGMRAPRGRAMSRTAGMVVVRSWWARAEVRQMVASWRVAASIQSQSVVLVSAGR
jgi:hypothetical protein